MKRIWVFILFIFFLFPVWSQNLIGKNKEEAETQIKTLYPDFVVDNSTVNHTYKYLKYIDKSNEQTLLVFLSENDVCTATKLISSYSNLAQVKQALNKKYKPAGKDTWRYNEKGIKYLVKLKREEWFFSVFTSKEK
jgi:hypothetical protein